MTGNITLGTNSLVLNGTSLKSNGANITTVTNGTTAQAFRVYNTDDGSGNTEYGTFDFTTQANVLNISTVKTGTGLQRQIVMNAASTNFQVAGTTKWQVNTTAFVPGQNNSSDIGSTSSQMVRTMYLATSLQGSATKVLTESSATSFVSVSVANSSYCAGHVDYVVFAADASDAQSVTGQLFFSAVATSAGAVTAAGLSDQHNLNPTTTGTLTNAMTQTTGTNLLTLQANAASSLSQTTLKIDYRVMLSAGTCTVTGL